MIIKIIKYNYSFHNETEKQYNNQQYIHVHAL